MGPKIGGFDGHPVLAAGKGRRRVGSNTLVYVEGPSPLHSSSSLRASVLFLSWHFLFIRISIRSSVVHAYTFLLLPSGEESSGSVFAGHLQGESENGQGCIHSRLALQLPPYFLCRTPWLNSSSPPVFAFSGRGRWGFASLFFCKKIISYGVGDISLFISVLVIGCYVCMPCVLCQLCLAGTLCCMISIGPNI